MQNQFHQFSLSLSAASADRGGPARDDAWLDHLQPAADFGRETWYQHLLVHLGDLLIKAGKSLKEQYAAPQAVAWSTR